MPRPRWLRLPNGRTSRALFARGGRPDLALPLHAVRAPTLLIVDGADLVGGADLSVIQLNRSAENEYSPKATAPTSQFCVINILGSFMRKAVQLE